jgi:hypothetical protein
MICLFANNTKPVKYNTIQIVFKHLQQGLFPRDDVVFIFTYISFNNSIQKNFDCDNMIDAASHAIMKEMNHLTISCSVGVSKNVRSDKNHLSYICIYPIARVKCQIEDGLRAHSMYLCYIVCIDLHCVWYTHWVFCISVVCSLMANRLIARRHDL